MNIEQIALSRGLGLRLLEVGIERPGQWPTSIEIETWPKCFRLLNVKQIAHLHSHGLKLSRVEIERPGQKFIGIKIEA